MNHGTQARKDIEVMRQQVAETKEMLLKTIQDQQQQNTELRNLITFQEKERRKDKAVVLRLIQELNKKDKETEQYPSFPIFVLPLGKSLIVVCL